MKQRIITAIILGIVAIPICIFSGTIIFPIAMAFIGVVGVWELLGCMGTRKYNYLSIPLYIMAAASPFIFRYFANEIKLYSDKLLSILLCFALYLLGAWVFSYEKDQKVDIKPVITSALIALYIIGATNCIILIRDVTYGAFYWYFIFIGAWVTDTFAYFSGMLFGKHKLIPAVSPKKTVEGAIGGTLFCVIFFVVYGAIVNHFTDSSINLLLVGFAGLVSALVSQIGDLSMSVIKRTYGIKDYGKIFPGHGGVLDRFDSILAVAIVLALILV